jgi:hypothetical protein
MATQFISLVKPSSRAATLPVSPRNWIVAWRRSDLGRKLLADFLDCPPDLSRRRDCALRPDGCIAIDPEHAHDAVARHTGDVAAARLDGGGNGLDVAVDDEDRVERQAARGEAG